MTTQHHLSPLLESTFSAREDGRLGGERGHVVFSMSVFFAILVGLVIALYWKPYDNTIKDATAAGALEAVKLMKDWGVWMASIQTATLAALGIFAKEGASSAPLSAWKTRLLILTAMLNTAALFFSAWLLTSLSSLALRVDRARRLDNYDVYNLPLFHFHEGKDFGKVLTVGYIALCNHWLWALGVLSFGLLTVSLAIARGKGATPGKPQTYSLTVPAGVTSLTVTTRDGTTVSESTGEQSRA